MAVASFVFSIKQIALSALVTFVFVTVNSSYGCTFNSDCARNQVCCNRECVNGASCVGHYCSSDFDFPCSITGGESCCNKKCVKGSNCLGYSCSTDSDCKVLETCCHGTCQNSYEDCYNSAGVVIGAIIGSLVFILFFSVCICLACRRQRRLQGSIIIIGEGTTANTFTATGATRENPPHQGQIPPPYQQGYPYYPPPQYEHPQQTTSFPPPYNPGTMAGSDVPPPYTAESQGLSGGVYAHRHSYGALPSAPPHVV